MGSFRQSRGAFHARTKREERRDTRARRMAEESGADDEDADEPEHQLQQSARSFEWWATLALPEPPAEEEEGWSAKSMCFPSGLSSCWPARSQGAATSPLIETQLQQSAPLSSGGRRSPCKSHQLRRRKDGVRKACVYHQASLRAGWRVARARRRPP